MEYDNKPVTTAAIGLPDFGTEDIPQELIRQHEEELEQIGANAQNEECGEEEDQVDNLKSLVSQLNDCIPRGFKNIKVISLQVIPLDIRPFFGNDIYFRERERNRFHFTEMIQLIHQ